MICLPAFVAQTYSLGCRQSLATRPSFRAFELLLSITTAVNRHLIERAMAIFSTHCKFLRLPHKSHFDVFR